MPPEAPTRNRLSAPVTPACMPGSLTSQSARRAAFALMHRRGIELVLAPLEVIEPLDRAVELGAVLLGELGLHVGDLVGEFGAIELLERGGDVGQHREALVGHFGKPAEHDDLLTRAARRDGEDSWPDRGHDRRMSGEHAEIALDAGDVNLIDFAGEGEFFRGDEIEVEGGHGATLSAVTRGHDQRVHLKKVLYRWIAGSSSSKSASRFCPTMTMLRTQAASAAS